MYQAGCDGRNLSGVLRSTGDITSVRLIQLATALPHIEQEMITTILNQKISENSGPADFVLWIQ
jgi:hypothetical protein